MSIIEKSYQAHLKANTEEVYDVSGAGDTVVAFFSACIAAKIDTCTSAEVAHLAAGIVVKKSGATTVKAEEIFLSGTVKKIMPVSVLDNHQVGSGKPGGITRKIMRLYLSLLDNL